MPNTRGTWNNKRDFIIALFSYGVGLGNVWRFPYLAYSSGGGAFLIPFIISSVVVGIPYVLLEVSLGQWMKEGGIGAWNLTPIFKGIGFAQLIIVFFGNVYYEVILAWTLRYLLDSFSFELPWKSCLNTWNTACCSEKLLYGRKNIFNFTNATTMLMTTSTIESLKINDLNLSSICNKSIDPITEYWERNILGISSGIDDLGSIKWDLFFSLLVAWIIVYFCIFRGMKSSSVVVYTTAIMPYIFLFILLIRGLFLPGAMEGIRYYLQPDWEKLTHFQVWSDAGTQVFYSYGIGIAALVALGSYNEFHHNSYRDVVIFTVMNSLTSILSGFVIFTVLGYMSHIQGVPISEVAEEGPGLAFIVYPQALALMPFSSIWSIMFFIMLFLLGLGTQVVAAEAITTAIIDEYMPVIKPYFDFKYTKELFSLINVFISFICGIPMITHGGMYIFQIFDYYAASRTLLFVGLFECIAISYFYGVKRYCKNLEQMWRFKLGPWLKVMWVFATPLFTLGLIIMTVLSYEELSYNRTYKYPHWALMFGWCLSVSSIICIPVYAIFKVISTSGSVKERLSHVRNIRLKSHQLGMADVENAQNDSEGQAVENSTLDENKKFIIDGNNIGLINKSSSASLNEASEFSNSRTIIKPF